MESELLNIRVLLQSILNDANNIPDHNIQKLILEKIDKIDSSFRNRLGIFDDIFSNLFLSLLRYLRKCDFVSEIVEIEIKETENDVDKYKIINKILDDIILKLITESSQEIADKIQNIKNKDSIKFKQISPTESLLHQFKCLEKYMENNRVPISQIDIYKNIDMDSEEISQYFKETFNDVNLYHDILKQSLDSSTNNSSNNTLSLRKSAFKDLQNRVTKDRKLKYISHQKLVGFMPPQPCPILEDETRENLLLSLLKTTKREN